MTTSMTDAGARPADAGRRPALDVSTAKPRFRPGRILIALIILFVLVQIVMFLVTNKRFGWPIVGEYLFNPAVMAGLGMSLFLTVIGMVIGSVVGTLLAAGQLSDFGPVRWVCQLYVGIFRGIPPLVQLIFWYNLAYLVPRIIVGVPFGPELFSWNANDVISPLTAAIVGLSLHEAAYMSEIVRAGVLSVDPGQRDAASAMGFSRMQTFWKVILPQSMRVIIPPTGSQFISLLKGTSLVSVIAMGDLLHAVQVIYNNTYQVVPLLMVAVIWYLVVVTILTFGQRQLEKYFGRGYDRAGGKKRAVKRVLVAEGAGA
jgi:polar amino acid transport system permease protein